MKMKFDLLDWACFVAIASLSFMVIGVSVMCIGFGIFFIIKCF